MARQATTLGDEEVNSEALASIQDRVMEGERILFQSGFHWGSKVIALTNLAVIVGDKSEGVVGFFPYEEYQTSREDRTLIVSSTNENGQPEEIRYKMGNDAIVRELRRHIYRVRRNRISKLSQANGEGTGETVDKLGRNSSPATPTTLTREERSIGERVKLWEEQDKINQELIPRVIRQSELLTKHIGEHDNLPQVAGNAISQALTGAREEQGQQYEAALGRR